MTCDPADPRKDAETLQRFQEPSGLSRGGRRDRSVDRTRAEVGEDVRDGVPAQKRGQLTDSLRIPKIRLPVGLAVPREPAVVPQPSMLDPYAVAPQIVPAVGDVPAGGPERVRCKREERQYRGNDERQGGAV